MKRKDSVFLRIYLICGALFFLGEAKPFPPISEQFSMTVQMNEVMQNNELKKLGSEQIWRDTPNKKNHIFLPKQTEFAPTAWGQIDLGIPQTQLTTFLQYQYNTTSNSWNCQNATVNMQWSSFWDFQDATYIGQTTIDKHIVGQWNSSDGDGWSVLSVEIGSNQPIQILMMTTRPTRQFLYRYENWQSGPPPISDFQLPKGTICTPSNNILSKLLDSNCKRKWKKKTNESLVS